MELHAGLFAKKVANAFYPLAACLAHQQLDLILDTVMLVPAEMEHLQRALGSGVQWLRVGLAASVACLEERERQRGDRTAGSARWEAERTHASQE